jgi:hypothetical protein
VVVRRLGAFSDLGCDVELVPLAKDVPEGLFRAFLIEYFSVQNDQISSTKYAGFKATSLNDRPNAQQSRRAQS